MRRLYWLPLLLFVGCDNADTSYLSKYENVDIGQPGKAVVLRDHGSEQEIEPLPFGTTARVIEDPAPGHSYRKGADHAARMVLVEITSGDADGTVGMVPRRTINRRN